MNRPNVLLLVWDACRTDYLHHAKTFGELASDGIAFKAATAPSRWSLPSHASIFHGSLPSSHGICNRHDHVFAENPLVTALNDEGYYTAGVSANFFASAAFDFDREFDQFTYTRRNTDDQGIDIGDATNRADDNGMSGIRKYF